MPGNYPEESIQAISYYFDIIAFKLSSRAMPSHAEKHQGAALHRPVVKSRRTVIVSVVTAGLMLDLTDDSDTLHT
jgi:hypothetical protein